MSKNYLNMVRILALGCSILCIAACTVSERDVTENYLREANSPHTSPTIGFQCKKKLFFRYLNGQSGLSEMESTFRARQLQHQINEESKLYPSEYFVARLMLAVQYANESYERTKETMHKNAHLLFKELLTDKTLNMDQQKQVRSKLAMLYIFTKDKNFVPEDGKNVISAVLELAKDFMDHPELSGKDWFEINYGLVYMYCHCTRLSNMNVDEGRTEAIRICNKILKDNRITDVNKKFIDEALIILNKSDSNPEEIFAFKQKA
ncbi:MAG: hypothetical protein V4482_06685 [Pseudomonadota bacterium]